MRHWKLSPHSRLTTVAIFAAAALVSSFALWDPLVIDERAHVERLTSHAARSLSSDLETDLRARILAQVRLARDWATREPRSREEAAPQARLFLADYPGELAVLWMDPAHRVHWVVTADQGYREDELARGTDAHARTALGRLASNDGEPAVISRPFRLHDGTLAVSTHVPVFRGKQLAGVVAGVFDVRATLESILMDHRELGYGVSVLDEKTELYRFGGAGQSYESTWAQEFVLSLAGISWRLRVWPQPATLGEMRSALPELAFVLGGLLGFLLVVTIHFARASQRTSGELRRAQEKLETRVRDRTIALEHTNQALESEIVERTRAEHALRKLSGRLLRLQDDERRRIARELHDSTTQLLGAVSINVDRARQDAETRGDPQLSALLTEGAAFLERASQEIRTVSYLLHPPLLDELGLEYVVPWFVEGFSARSGIGVTVTIQPGLGRLPTDVELTLFRIAQEALTNVHRHSGSANAEIVLCREANSVALEISDHGCGLPPGVLDAAEGIARLGVGIAGMRERVRQLGGCLEITSDSHGTRIRTVLPLHAGATVSSIGPAFDRTST